MPKIIEVEAWLIVDTNENYVVASDCDEAADRYAEDVGENDATPRRTIRVTLKVPVPEVIELTADVPEESTPTALTVK